MVAKEHTIHKVFVEVNTRSKKTAETYKNSIENFLQEEVFPAIENYFNSQEIDSKVFIQQIANLKIEVDIANSNKSITSNSVKREIKEQLITKLKAVFKEPELHEVTIKTRTISESKLDTFFYFLEHGTTAWWNQKEEKTFTKKRLFEITENSSFEKRFLMSLKNPVQRKRLIQQFKTEELYLLFLGVFNKPEEYKAFLLTIKKFDFTSFKIKNKVWNIFINALLNKDFSTITKDVQEAIKILKQTNSFYNEQEELVSFLKLLISKNNTLSTQFNNEKRERRDSGKIEKNTTNTSNISFANVTREREKSNIGNIDEFTKTNSDIETRTQDLNTLHNECSVENKEQEAQRNISLLNEVKGIKSQNKKEKLKKQPPINKNQEEKQEEKQEEFKTEMKLESKVLKKDDASPITQKLKEEKRADYQRRHQEALKNTFLVKNEVASEFKSHLVKNVGLILLHPFLKQFFNSCGFLNKENKIIKPHQAVHLLHYVATKKEQQFENNLVFEKFLCNLPIQSSIERNIVLDDALKEKSEELLRAVLQNWSVLKKSSNDLLRNEYLQREGKLDLTKDNPTLTVERKTQDILLDTKLPWNLSLCKLPWKKELIFTNW
ncbi:contractile injection system tape measure protein [Tenacibaculum sp.]|uniref:contractile injection system tape measure protein n=1 Tax=Tenacibaculum sp. TaxID=1906242 RepID=UPI003AA8C807